MTDWSDEDLETLKACIDEGLSARETSRRLRGRYSRDACIGKAYRNGWRFGTGTDAKTAANREIGMKRRNDRLRAKIAERTREGIAKRKAAGLPVGGAAAAAPQPPKVDPAELPWPAPIGKKNAPPDDHPADPKTCRRIEGDPGRTDFQWCGRPTAMGRPYCAGCLEKLEPTKQEVRSLGRAPHWLVSTGAVQKVFA